MIVEVVVSLFSAWRARSRALIALGLLRSGNYRSRNDNVSLVNHLQQPVIQSSWMIAAIEIARVLPDPNPRGTSQPQIHQLSRDR